MALSLAALLPHSPLLIPEIGRANYDFLKKTAAAYGYIGAALQTAAVETIIVISPHAARVADAFVLNVAPEMAINLKDFGFIPPRTVLAGDAILADQIQNALRPDFSLQLVSEGLLDSGSAIPLYLLRSFAPTAKIIVMAPATGLTLADQFRFGEKLRTVVAASDKTIALIASGDLSHRLQKKSPGGYSPKGAKFDNKLIEYLTAPTAAAANILNLDPKLIEGAGECGLKPLLILLGALAEHSWRAEILAYQTDFGIGYLSVNFALYGE
jgi:aromatic ring-opening dioxygenase LigB subunit